MITCEDIDIGANAAKEFIAHEAIDARKVEIWIFERRIKVRISWGKRDYSFGNNGWQHEEVLTLESNNG